MAMTRRERVIAALEFRKPDYTPYWCAFTGQMRDKMIAHLGDASFEEKINQHLWHTELQKPQIDLGNERFLDECGVVWNKSGVDKDIGVVETYRLADEDALESLDLPIDEAYIRSALAHHVATKADRFCIAGIGFVLFERAWTLRGMEELLCDMVVNPVFVHRLMEKICTRAERIIDIVLEYDVDGVYLGDDYGQQKGLIMGLPYWREFIKPYLSRLYARIRKGGKYVCQHSCGDLREVLDEMVDMGLNMYFTYQPEIYTFEYTKHLHGRLTICGGISTQIHLPCLSPDEIYRLTKEWMAHCPDGGLIAAPTHAIPGDVPPENVLAMLRAMDEQTEGLA